MPEAEQVPAKIWELLRRNEKFKRTVARFQELDRRLQEANAAIKTLLGQGARFGEDGERGIHLDQLCEKSEFVRSQTGRLLEAVKAQHPFAGRALEWLVPEPLFIVSKVGLPEGFDLKGKSCAPHETISYGEGTTPDPRDRKHWHWRRLHPGKPDTRGGLMRRGPIVEWRTSAFAPFRSPVNPIAEWKEHHQTHGPFTLADSWKNAPSHFKRIYCAIWRNFDNRAKDSLTGLRFDAANEHEVNFFQGWRLGDQLAEATQRGSLIGDDVFHSLQFDNLARNFRVFAVPKSILTKGEANRLGKWLARELRKGLRNQTEMLGNETEWNTWLSEPQKHTAQSEANDSHYYRRRHYIDSLCTIIYPTFDLAKLLTPAKHRARYKPYVPKGRQS